jgi:tRNA nucleotidyltransferase/poly(A) polymerase
MSEAREAAKSIVEALQARGRVAYFAGGCVRDELLGEHPEDYDIATDARPEQVREIFPRVSEVGASFGVMLLKERGHTIEVATFREEGEYSDRRRPDEVCYSDAEHDARRRDFTINALFLDPTAPPREITIRGRGIEIEGEVIDHVGGVSDLGAGVVRAVGDPERRLAEDHLRALRAVRFAARLGFEIEERTATAITAHARELEGVSHERVGDELRRMLSSPSRGRAVELIGALELDGPALQDQLPESPGSAGVVGALPAEADAQTALAAWGAARLIGGEQEAMRGRLADAVTTHAAERLVRSWRRSLCLSNAERSAVAGVLAGLGRLARSFLDEPVAAQKRAIAGDWFRGALAVLEPIDPDRAAAVRARADELRRSAGGVAPDALLDGSDLLGLGFEPGPGIGRALKRLYDLQLEGRVMSREEALEAARRLQPQDGESP